MTKKTDGKSGRFNLFERVTKILLTAFVTAYQTGGIPLVLIFFGAVMVVEVEFDVFFDGSSVLPQREIFLIGIGLVLAGAVCWTFSVYMMQQRASEKLRVIEAIVEAAANSVKPDAFFDSASEFLMSIDFSITVTGIHAAQAQKTVKPPNGDSEKKESPSKDASRSENLPDLSDLT